MLNLKYEDREMKKIIMLGIILGMVLSLGGCFIPYYADDGGRYGGHGGYYGGYRGYYGGGHFYYPYGYYPYPYYYPYSNPYPY